MPYVFAYTRVSHADQAEHGSGLEAQRLIVTAEGNQLISAREGYGWYPEAFGLYEQRGLVVDPAVSAYRVDFRDRPGGAWIFDRAHRGDVIIVARLDRTFRRMRDFLNTVQVLEERGVELRICSPRLNAASPSGRAMLQSYMVWAEWDSAMKSQRIREALAVKRELGAKKTAALAKPSPVREAIDAASVQASVVADAVRLSAQPQSLRDKYLNPKPVASHTGGRIFSYLRNSHVTAADGLGVESQRGQAAAKADRLMLEYNGLTMGPVLYDRSVSAYRKPFASRPAGAVLASQVRVGDHVIFARSDRAFRNVVDCLTTVRSWLAKGVHVHFLDMPDVDLNDAAGQAMMAQSALFCEMESSLQSARRKEGAVARVAQGGFPGPTPNGYSIRRQRRDGKIAVQWDMEYLRMARYARWLRHRYMGQDYVPIVAAIENVLAAREGRVPVKPLGQYNYRSKKTIYPEWPYWRVRLLCLQGGKLLEEYAAWKQKLLAELREKKRNRPAVSRV